MRVIKKIKYLLFKYRIHNLLPKHKLVFLGHLSGLSKWISQQKNISYSDFPVGTYDYSRRYGLYEFLINKENLDAEIDYLEFGVAKGESFRWWVDRIQHQDARFYGFDTFTGLPEDWGPFKKGDMSNGNELPLVNDNRNICRHTFYQGIFQDTLCAFLETYSNNKRKVIHLDADLYSSTLFVLTSLSPYLKSGDIILFDEFNVPMHEFKAFSEWASSFYIDYEVMAEVNNFFQVGIKIN